MTGATPTPYKPCPDIRAERIGPIIEPGIDIDLDVAGKIGHNIQGPSLILAPSWLQEPLGRYYLYFADHKGDHIRLAVANSLTGPWSIHPGGTLQLSQSGLPTEPPVRPENFQDRNAATISGYKPHPDQAPYIPTREDDCRIPHIASPEMLIDDDKKRIVMYFHGLESYGKQMTRVAVSSDGIHFQAQPETVAGPYLRLFHYQGQRYGLSMPGHLYHGDPQNISQFRHFANIFPSHVRHLAPLVRGDQLLIFHSRVGDCPESILISRVDLRPNPEEWRATEPQMLLQPELAWEGADLPLQPSSRSAITIPVRQLRDPDIFCEGDDCFLLYAIRGEAGIALAKLEWQR